MCYVRCSLTPDLCYVRCSLTPRLCYVTGVLCEVWPNVLCEV